MKANLWSRAAQMHCCETGCKKTKVDPSHQSVVRVISLSLVHSIIFLTCYKFVTKTHNSPEGIFVTFITRDIGHGCELLSFYVVVFYVLVVVVDFIH